VTRKHAGKKESAENDQEELSALIRSIKLSQKYYLFFVACNQIPRQNELIADIKAKLPTKYIEVIGFKEPVTNLLTELKQKLKDKSPDAIFVQGLGNSISSDGIGKENSLIHSLNLTRDSFNDAFQCPIYLWLPEYAVIKITRNAPDFFSVRSGVFYFSSTAEQVISDIFQSTSSEWLEVSSLPLSEKQKRIAMLESLLAEYKDLDEKKRDESAEVRLLRNLGSLFESTSDYRKAIKYFEMALAISHQLSDQHGEATDLNNLGNVYSSLGNYRQAITYFERTLKIAKEIDDRHGQDNGKSGLGNAYFFLGEYKKAIKYFEMSLKIAKEMGNKQSESRTIGNLGLVYIYTNQLYKAIEYQQNALTISKEIGDKQGTAQHLGNIGITYSHLGEYRKAIECQEEALKIARELGNKYGEGSILGNLGVGYAKLGEKEKAKEYHIKALSIFEAIQSPYAERTRQNLARLE
jgi:tetratricopeptide (TPR) repeat protein